MPKEEAPELALLLSSAAERADSVSGPILRIRADVVSIDAAGRVRNLSCGRWDRHPAAGLVAGSLVWADMGSQWDLEYRDIYSADLDAIGGMATYLRKVSRALARMDETRGRAETFGEYVVRVGEAIGAGSYIWKREPDERRGWSHDEQNYRHADARTARGYVDGLVTAFRADHAPEVVS